jgi:nucleoside-diphosphate-sugar epimerase
MTEIAAIEESLSCPTELLVGDMARLPGNLLILGAGGKMGPSLCRLAARSSAQAGTARSIVAVSRFGVPGLREQLEADGITTLAVDLLAPGAMAGLPDADNVVLMTGSKFGTDQHPEHTWASNVGLPFLVARRFASSRIVALSTGNVYSPSLVAAGGSREDDRPGPVGEYAQSALGRERVLEHASRSQGTPMVFLRLNYAIEPRYGVLRDIADKVMAGDPIDLTVGHVNVIWQRDANAIVLRAFHHVATPPAVFNLTGPDVVSVRALAKAFGAAFGKAPVFEGIESDEALLSDASRCQSLFGTPPIGLPEMIDRVAAWVMQGGASLDKPTGYDRRDGHF